MNIFNIIVDALEFNEGIDFMNLLMCMGLYWILFWFSISVWVFLDARKRYGNPRIAFLWSFIVFFLFFPALIFYLAVRKPEDLIESPPYNEAGVNVPLVNFVGERGIRMTLELNIYNTPEQDKKLTDMAVDVRWKSKQNKFKVVDDGGETKNDKDLKRNNKLNEIITGIKRRFKEVISNLRKKFIYRAKEKEIMKKIDIGLKSKYFKEDIHENEKKKEDRQKKNQDHEKHKEEDFKFKKDEHKDKQEDMSNEEDLD